MKKFFIKSLNIQKGFTLAEVLITIGIIGFIFVLATFILHGTIDKKHHDVRINKMISRLAQALRVNRVTHDFENWDDIFGENGGDNIQKDLFDRQLHVIAEDKSNAIGEKFGNGRYFIYSAGNGYIYTLKDGIQYSIFQNEDSNLKIENEDVKVILTIDTNGINRGPNMVGQDIRMIVMTPNRVAEYAGGEMWCGEECLKTVLGVFAVNNISEPKPFVTSNESYRACTQQGMILTSPEEMTAILSTEAGREALGVNDYTVTCFNLRSSYIDYGPGNVTCYNSTNGKIATVGTGGRVDGDETTSGFKSTKGSNMFESLNNGNFFDTNYSSWSKFKNSNDYKNSNFVTQSVCVKDEELAEFQSRGEPYSNAEMVIAGKAFKRVFDCHKASAPAFASVADGSVACPGTSVTSYDNSPFTNGYAARYCAYFGMRLPTYDEIAMMEDELISKQAITADAVNNPFKIKSSDNGNYNLAGGNADSKHLTYFCTAD